MMKEVSRASALWLVLGGFCCYNEKAHEREEAAVADANRENRMIDDRCDRQA